MLHQAKLWAQTNAHPKAGRPPRLAPGHINDLPGFLKGRRPCQSVSFPEGTSARDLGDWRTGQRPGRKIGSEDWTLATISVAHTLGRPRNRCMLSRMRRGAAPRQAHDRDSPDNLTGWIYCRNSDFPIVFRVVTKIGITRIEPTQIIKENRGLRHFPGFGRSCCASRVGTGGADARALWVSALNTASGSWVYLGR